jgi:hypothetical protein
VGKRRPFPQTITVCMAGDVEEDCGTDVVVLDDGIRSVDDGRRVAIYRLESVGTVDIKRSHGRAMDLEILAELERGVFTGQGPSGVRASGLCRPCRSDHDVRSPASWTTTSRSAVQAPGSPRGLRYRSVRAHRSPARVPQSSWLRVLRVGASSSPSYPGVTRGLFRAPTLTQHRARCPLFERLRIVVPHCANEALIGTREK